MDFYTQFKPFRNKVRSLDTDSVVILCIKKLHELDDKDVTEWGGYLPWSLLFLIKIAFIEGNSSFPSRIATENDLAQLINMIKDLDSKVPFEEEIPEIRVAKLMRSMAFQQFWLQKPINNFEIGRQLQLFETLP